MRTILALAVVLTLGACGGGQGGDAAADADQGMPAMSAGDTSGMAHDSMMDHSAMGDSTMADSMMGDTAMARDTAR